MKKFFITSLTAVFLLWGCGNDDSDQDPTDDNPSPEARTAIPDANFEAALVDLNLDDAVDGSVLTSRIESVQNLNLENRDIQDLTGIEDFDALIDLNVRSNDLQLLNISSNTNLLFVWAENNQLTQVLIGSNPNIEKIGASGNKLTSLEVNSYTTLQLLDLANNEIVSMNVSNLPLPVFNEFKIEGNPLTCILVSQEQLENTPASWTKDPEDTYSLDCL